MWRTDDELPGPELDYDLDDVAPAKEEPNCGFCNDSGCIECDPAVEGPRRPWWWFSAALDARGFGVEDEDGWPIHYLTGADLLPRNMDGRPF
jgi:hypothetical protein